MKKIQNKTIIIKAGHLLTLCQWLKNLPLDVKKTRERSKFLAIAKPPLEEIEEDRIKLVKAVARKNSDGEYIILKQEDGKFTYDIDEKDQKDIEKEYNAMFEGEVELDLEGNSGKLEVIRDILENTNFQFQGRLADEYEKWCSAFDIE